MNPSNFCEVSQHNLVAEAAEVSMINACIKACATASEWSKALHLFSLIKKPNFFYLDPLVRACSKSSARVQAGGIWMFDSMRWPCFLTDVVFFGCFGRIKVAQHMKNVWSCFNLYKTHRDIFWEKIMKIWRYETPFQERIYTTSYNKEIVISWEVEGPISPSNATFPFQEIAGLIRGFLGDSGFMVVDPARQAQKLLQLQERLTRSQWRGKKKTGVVWHGLGWYPWNLVPPNHPF